jgi:hypothetical protein
LKILITGGKSALALKLLKAFEQDSAIITDYGDVPTFFSNNYKFISLGERNDETLAHTLLSCCLDHQVDAILPLHIFEIESIIKASILFQEFNVHVLLPNLEQFNNYRESLSSGKINWAVFLNGEVFYLSNQSEALGLHAKRENLSGAYYFEVVDEKVELELITI